MRTSLLGRVAAAVAAPEADWSETESVAAAARERVEAMARWDLSAEEHAAVVDAAAAERPPSFLIVAIDGWRADRGPHTERGRALMPRTAAALAKATVFSRAYAPAVTSWPSFRSAATGFYPDTFLRGVGDPPSFFRALKERGYRTALYAGLPILDRRSPYGADFDEANLETPSFVLQAERARRLLAEARPWCVRLHAGEAHLPYEAPEHLVREPGPEGRYDACLRSLDDPLADLLAALPEDVVVVVTADHGEDFPHERGIAGHGASLYESAVRVPLVWRGIGFVAGEFSTPVSLTDLSPTILGLAGESRPPFVEGLSLLPVLRGGSATALRGRPAVFAEQRFDLEGRLIPKPIRASISATRKIVAFERPSRLEVFDLTLDPGERRPKCAPDDPAVVAAKDEFRRLLRRRALRLDMRLGGGALSLGFDGDDERRLIETAAAEDPAVRRSAARLLAARRRPAATETFRRLLRDADAEVRAWAAVGLGRSSGDGPDWPAETALRGPSAEAREAAMVLLAERPRPEAAAALAELCAGQDAMEDWRPVALLIAAGDRRGLARVVAAAAHPRPHFEGWEAILRVFGVRPRPGSPAVLELAARRFGDRPEWHPYFLEAATALPSDAAERIVDGLARTAGAADGAAFVSAREELARRRAEAVRRLEAGEAPPAWWLGPFHAAWGLAPGVDFLRPPVGALDVREWVDPPDEFPLRALRGQGASVALPRAPEARTVQWSFVALEAGEAEFRIEGGAALRHVYGPGYGSVRLPLAPGAAEGAIRTTILLISGAPSRIGFREVVLLRSSVPEPR
jgi:arylsulfatase A-like enzyme